MRNRRRRPLKEATWFDRLTRIARASLKWIVVSGILCVDPGVPGRVGGTGVTRWECFGKTDRFTDLIDY